MTETPKDVDEYFENSKCKICGDVVQPHFQGNTKLPKEEHLAEKHNFAKHQFGKTLYIGQDKSDSYVLHCHNCVSCCNNSVFCSRFLDA